MNDRIDPSIRAHFFQHETDDGHADFATSAISNAIN